MASKVFAWVHVIRQVSLGLPVVGGRAYEFVDGEGGVKGAWMEYRDRVPR